MKIDIKIDLKIEISLATVFLQDLLLLHMNQDVLRVMKMKNYVWRLLN